MLVDTSIPQPQPLPATGVMSSSDIVDHLDKVLAAQPQPVQAAVDHAHSIMGMNPPSSNGAVSPLAQSPAPSAPEAAPMSSAPAGGDSAPLTRMSSDMPDHQPLPVRASGPAMDSPSPVTPLSVAQPIQNPHMQNLERMTAEGPGVNKIHNPFLRGLAKVGDVIGSGIFPEFAQFVPGTTAHHAQLIGEEENQLGNEQKATKATDESRLQNAQATEAESLPALHESQAENSALKITNARDIADAKNAIAQSEHDRKSDADKAKNSSTLARLGYKLDQNGQMTPLTYDEMSEEQKGVHDLKASQKELADAHALLAKAQKENIPILAQQAQARIAVAQQNAATAAGRLGLSKDQFEAEFMGTHGGEALSGVDTDENGNPIGTKVTAVTKPGATDQGRASQAESIIEAGNNLKAEIDKHKDKLGNVGSYWNQFVNGTPISDPDTARLMSEIASYAALQPAMHGMRGGQVMKEFEKMVGGVPKNPEALKAAIDGIASTASVMAKQGGAHKSASHADVVTPQPKTQAEYDALKSGTVYIDLDGIKKKKK